MKISLTELTEDGEFTLNPPFDRCIHGWIQDDERIIAQYFASWPRKSPSGSITFDLIIGDPEARDPLANRQLLCLVHNGVGSPSFKDARKRPLAKRFASVCKIPTIQSYDDDIAVGALNLVKFIIKHDSRLVGHPAARA